MAGAIGALIPFSLRAVLIACEGCIAAVEFVVGADGSGRFRLRWDGRAAFGWTAGDGCPYVSFARSLSFSFAIILFLHPSVYLT